VVRRTARDSELDGSPLGPRPVHGDPQGPAPGRWRPLTVLPGDAEGTLLLPVSSCGLTQRGMGQPSQHQQSQPDHEQLRCARSPEARHHQRFPCEGAAGRRVRRMVVHTAKVAAETRTEPATRSPNPTGRLIGTDAPTSVETLTRGSRRRSSLRRSTRRRRRASRESGCPHNWPRPSRCARGRIHSRGASPVVDVLSRGIGDLGEGRVVHA